MFASEAASLAQKRTNDVEAIFTSSPLGYRFAEWIDTPRSPEATQTPRVKPVDATPSASASTWALGERPCHGCALR